MLIFIDFEFSDFISTLPISCGLIDQKGRSLYIEFPINPLDCTDFVRETVLPQIGKTPGALCSPEEGKNRILEWLAFYQNDDDPVVICYDYSGDWALLDYVLESEIPKWIRNANVSGRYINELREEIFWRDHPELRRHHALNDAMALKASFVLDRWLNKPK